VSATHGQALSLAVHNLWLMQISHRLSRSAVWRRMSPARWPVALLAGAVLLPLIRLAFAWLNLAPEVWQHLWETLLPEMVLNTVLLTAGVGAITLCLGTTLAWLVTNFDFPGARLAEWLLVLPLAIPGYIFGYVFMALFDYAGPFQSQLRAWFGPSLEWPEFRSLPGAIFTLSLSLYPYVYLLARAGFLELSAAQKDAARVQGYSDLAILFKVSLPLIRPSLAAGVSLAIMEALADFAVVRYFNTVTLSEGVVRLWVGQMDRDAAVQLASLLLLIALLVILIERFLRRQARYYQIGGQARPFTRTRLHGWRAALAAAAAGMMLLLAFVLPSIQLLTWAIEELTTTDLGTLEMVFGQYLLNTAGLSAGAASLVIAVALPIAYALRHTGSSGKERRLPVVARLATSGYAVPGTVIALGVLLLAAPLNEIVLSLTGGAVLLSASLFSLMYGYLVRFLAIGFNSIEASLEKITPNMELAARSLGAGTLRVLGRVYLPLISSGILVGWLTAFVDTFKELPATMFLRPFGMETLSVWTYMLASESAWQAAAIPSLVIVLVNAIFVVLLITRPVRLG
jgi:iron(III) transport system permease protein